LETLKVQVRRGFKSLVFMVVDEKTCLA